VEWQEIGKHFSQEAKYGAVIGEMDRKYGGKYGAIRS
jgi:hypothetical protein